MFNKSAEKISAMINMVAEKNANELKEKIFLWHQPEVPAELKK